MNNLGLKILAFLAAVTLWFLVVNIDDPGHGPGHFLIFRLP